MIKTIGIYITCLFILPAIAFGQKNAHLKIDTLAILENKNLDRFIAFLRTDSFQIHSDKNAIPNFIKKELKRLAKGFSIANPNQPYQCCCMSPESLPMRQLIFLAKSKNVLAITYKTGGLGVSTHLLLIEYSDDKIIDLWTGYCLEIISSAIELARYIEENKNKKWSLNRDSIFI